MTKPLEGKIAVVAGATRGAGRGIATALGEAGATVYCTGRSVPGSPGMKDRPETINETAEIVTARGGRGIAVRVDHTVPARGREPVRAGGRVRHPRQRHLGRRRPRRVGEEALGDEARGRADAHRPRDQDAHHHQLPRPPAAAPRAGSSSRSPTATRYFYRGHFFYDLVKTTVIRMAFALSQELKGRGVTALAVTPGLPALGVDARPLRRDRGELARRREEGQGVHRLGDAAVRRARRRRARGRSERGEEERTRLRVLGSRRGVRRRATPTARGRTSCAGCGRTCRRWRPDGRSSDDAFYAYWGTMPYEMPG